MGLNAGVRTRSETRSERGQVTILAALLLAGMALLMLLIVAAGNKAVSRARAQTAADAAALAAVTHGADMAIEVAKANGATARVLIRSSGSSTEARVDAEYDGIAASAQAQRQTAEPIGVVPALAAALARAEQLAGRAITVVSPARPMTDGWYVRVATDDAEALASVAEAVGICRPRPAVEPEYFAWCAGPNSG